MGGAVSTGEDNDDLIDNLLNADYIKSPSVERVFRAVDRAFYYTDDQKETAYKDVAWKCGNLHLSAPCIYSEVMESLKLEPNLSFLNLGSGTGYLSTMVGLILGPYGVNHGVEIHADVVDYALKKLDEFENTSQAMDEYEFCPPKFIVGNCLQLGSECRMYDRVYCGAACPREHENFMKNLIKVGGILVMPYNEEITRISQTKWEAKSVMPVSFATLILPKKEDCLKMVVLPENKPLSLQHVCRSVIRTILRQNVEQQEPRLISRNLRSPKRNAKKRCVRRFVIPIFEESDDNEGFSSSATSAQDGSGSESGDESQQATRRHLSAVIEHVFGQNQFVRDLMDTPNHVQIGVSSLNFSHSDQAVSDDDDDDDEDNDDEMHEEKEEMEVEENKEEDEEDVDDEPASSVNGGQSRHGRALLLSKRLTFQDAASDKEEVKPSQEPNLSYAHYLQEKIMALPLPLALKFFLNNYREFK